MLQKTDLCQLIRLICPLFVFIQGCGSTDSESQQAIADQYDIASGVSTSISAADGVLANDSGKDLRVSIVSKPQLDNNFSLNENGSFTYLASVDTKRTDSFSYKLAGASEPNATATVNLTIFPAPQVAPDNYTVDAGQLLAVVNTEGVLVNDSSDRAITAELVSAPTQSSQFQFSSDGAFNYRSTANDGSDSFSYRVSDGLQFSAPVEVSIIIKSLVLSGNDDSFIVESGKALKLSAAEGILHNDSGIANDVRIKLVKRTEHSIDFSLSEKGDLLYRTISDNQASDNFSYTISNDEESLGPFNVEIVIEQPPISAEPPGTYDQCTEFPFGQSISGRISANEITNPSFELLSQPRLGDLVAFDPSTGDFSYQRNSSARGQDSFSYKVFDQNNQFIADASQELIATPYRIMPVGDSITSGVELFNGSDDTPASNVRVGYRKFLKDSLASAGYSIDFVGSRSEGFAAGLADSQHNGFPGQDDRFVRDNIQTWLNTEAADIILLHIGTNGTKNHTEHITAAANTIDQWEQINNPLTVMMARLIQRTDDQTNADKILLFNNLIESFISNRKTTGDSIFKVDQFNALQGGGFLSADNLHPDSIGYERMSDEWRSRLIETGVLKRCK